MKKIAATVLVFATLVFATSFFSHDENRDAGKVSEQDPEALIALLESELSKPPSKDRYEYVADELLELIRQDKFEEVEKQISTLIAEKKLTQMSEDYLPALLFRWFSKERRVGKFPEDLLLHLDKWIEEYPASSIAYIIRGKYYANYAWEIRGDSVARTVSKDAWGLFRKNTNLSLLDLQKSYELDKSTPYALHSIMALDLPSQELVEQIFQTIVNDYKERPYFPAYRTKLVNLMPKWGGSWDQMFNFAHETAKNAPPKTLFPLILAVAYEEAGYRSKNIEEYYNYGNAWKVVENSYEKVINDFPKSARLRTEFANAAIYANRRDIAYKQIGEAIKIDPYKKRVYKTLKKLFNEQNDLHYQQIILDKFFTLYPEDHWGFRSLGSLFHKQKKFQEAADAFSEAIELNPYDVWSLRQRCDSYSEIADDYKNPDYYEKAIEDCTKVTEMTPNDAAGFNSLGWLLYKQEKLQESADAVSKAIELNPDDDWSWRHRCESYVVIAYKYNKPDYYEKAIEDCTKSIEINPDNARAYLSRGRSYTGLGKQSKAAEDYKMYEKMKE